MTDLRTAAQQALEALETPIHEQSFMQKQNAIAALRAALAERQEPNLDYPCRDDGRCQYAIDSGAEGLGHCPKGKCVMVRHIQPPEDIAVAQNNLKVMRQMFPEAFDKQAHGIS